MPQPQEESTALGLTQATGFPILGGYVFKLAETPDEQDQIERLLHQTFVLEVQQDEDTGTGRLIDKFHHKNTYIVAKWKGHVCGVAAVHDQPPFSAAGALEDGGFLEQLCPALLEVRRLAIKPAHRSGLAFPGLVWSVYEYARRGGYGYIVMSGLLERQGMYEKMGFRQLGPAGRKGAAFFVPMLVDLVHLPKTVERDFGRWQRRFGQ
jgi:hypothetical protein